MPPLADGAKRSLSKPSSAAAAEVAVLLRPLMPPAEAALRFVADSKVSSKSSPPKSNRACSAFDSFPSVFGLLPAKMSSSTSSPSSPSN